MGAVLAVFLLLIVTMEVLLAGAAGAATGPAAPGVPTAARGPVLTAGPAGGVSAPGAVPLPVPAGRTVAALTAPGCGSGRVGHSRLLVGESTTFGGCGFAPGTLVEIAANGVPSDATTADAAGRIAVPVSFMSLGTKLLTATGTGAPPAAAPVAAPGAVPLPATGVPAAAGAGATGVPAAGTSPLTLTATVLVVGSPTGADDDADSSDYGHGRHRPPKDSGSSATTSTTPSGLTLGEVIALLQLLQSQQRATVVSDRGSIPRLGGLTLGDLAGDELAAEEEAAAEEAAAVDEAAVASERRPPAASAGAAPAESPAPAAGGAAGGTPGGPG
ncbi:hypothetical protein AB1484_36660, partial [Parafrankia sp. FMc6]